MKAIVLYFLFTISLFGQETVTELEEEASALYVNGDKEKALQKFIALHENYPDTENAGLTFYNIAITYEEIDSITQAIKWYTKILDSDIIDNKEYYNFPDTHTNIKHRSACNLGNIYYNDKDNETALKYYFMALNDFPYYSSSGTSTKKNNIKVRQLIADCYDNLGQTDNAIRILLSDAITGTPWNENPVAKYLADHIAKKDNKKQFLKEFEKALATMKVRGDNYIIKIRDKEVIIYPYMEAYEDPKEFVKTIKERDFYRLLSK